MQNIYDIFSMYLTLGREDDGISIEDCGLQDAGLAGYHIVLPPENVKGMRQFLVNKYPSRKKLIENHFNNGLSSQIRVQCSIAPSALNTTYTQTLLEQFGNARGVLEYFGYLEPEVVDGVVEIENELVDEVEEAQDNLVSLTVEEYESMQNNARTLNNTVKQLREELNTLKEEKEEKEAQEVMGEEDFLAIYEFLSELPSEEVRDAVMQVCITLAEAGDMAKLTQFTLLMFEQLQGVEV